MKLQFNQTVKDKYTGDFYEPNTIYEFDDTRGEEILHTGFATRVEDHKGTKPIEPFVEEPAEEEPKPETKDLHELSRDELIKLAKDKGVAIRGSKEDIINRLTAE